MFNVFSVPEDAWYVGVHIRRADMVFDPKYTVADAGYFRRAVHFITREFPGRQLVFVVCTDDLLWSKQNFAEAVAREFDHVTVGNHGNGNHSDADATTNVSTAAIAFSENHSAEEDLAILSSCNHTIMTVGTYGWWAAYLAGGLTIYYRQFPAKQSELYRLFSREDHFPPEWIGL